MAAAKFLIVKDGRSKCIFAHAVPQKGVDSAGYAVDCIKRDILWLGCRKVILKSDNEKAIVKLLTEVLKGLRVTPIEQAMQQHPAAYDPNSNGATEVTCKRVGGAAANLEVRL